MSIRKPKWSGNSPQWVAVYVTHNLPEAHILLGKLKAHDLPAMLHQEAGASALGITLGNLGEVKILVAPSDSERALELLYPEDSERIEASNDKIQVIWQDDGDGSEYYVDDDEE